MKAAVQYPSLDAVASREGEMTHGEQLLADQAHLALHELDLLRELLRRHVMDWGPACTDETCGCADVTARRYLANLGIHPGDSRDTL